MSNEFGKTAGSQPAASPSARTGPACPSTSAARSDTFEFTMPKDLALHMANTIQKLASPAGKVFPKVT